MLPFWRAVLASQQPSVTGWSPVAGVGEALPRGRDLTLRDDNLSAFAAGAPWTSSCTQRKASPPTYSLGAGFGLVFI